MLKTTQILLLLLVFFCNSMLHAQTTLEIPASIDAEIFEKDAAKNFGNCDVIWVGPEASNNDFSRIVMQFDLSGIPACAIIDTAYLQLTTVSGGNDNASVVGAYRITEQWTEGSGSCTGNSANDVTWNRRTTSTNWVTAGGSFNNTAVSTAIITSTAGTVLGWNLKSLVASWVNGTFSNFGVLLKYVNENQNAKYGVFASSEHSTIGIRPRLVVSYRVPLNATVTVNQISTPSSSDGSIVLTSPSGAPSNTYQYQLNNNAWQSSGSFTNLAIGNYEVKMRDASFNTCVKSFGLIKIFGGADLSVKSTFTSNSTSQNMTEGDSLTFTVKVFNLGPFDATGVVLTETLPSQLNFVSASTNKGIFNSASGAWSIGALNDGDSATLTFNGVVSNYGSFNVISAITASSQGDSVSSNNTTIHEFLSQKSFEAGACIINLGITSSANAGLKPYGLVFDLVRNYKVPVYWAINPNKTFGSSNTKTDQIDFTVNSVNYRGGAFIIPAEFAKIPAIASVISTWVSSNSGLTVNCNQPAFSAPIHGKLTGFSNAVLDQQNGTIAVTAFFNPSGISSFYNASNPVNQNPYRIGTPLSLAACDDIYIMPHADPHLWNGPTRAAFEEFIDSSGWLFGACHAVSSLEGLYNTNGLHLLSNNGLVDWNNHNDGTEPYQYSLGAGEYYSNLASDPYMQFIGEIDYALQGGSEEIYIPNSAGWRSTTTIAIWDSANIEAPGAYPTGAAAVLAYGRSFGNDDLGMVLYMGSHSFQDGNTAEDIGAARVLGNFWFDAALEFTPTVSSSVSTLSNVTRWDTLEFPISINTKSSADIISVDWSSTCGGTFDVTDSLNPKYTFPNAPIHSSCIITVNIEDECGRFAFESFVVETTMVTDYGDLSIASSQGAQYYDANDDGTPEGKGALWLGELVTDEITANTNAMANADGADDGLLMPAFLDSTVANSFKVIARSLTAGEQAYVRLRVDWNNNGVFDSTYTAGFTTSASGRDTLSFNVWTPNGQGVGTINYRVLITADSLDLNDTLMYIGEVEDYQMFQASPVPVKLLDFKANWVPSGARVHWATATEVNNDHFELLRSFDNQSFETVAHVPSQAIGGNSNNLLNYEFLDDENVLVIQSLVYYKLIQTDFDGTSEIFGPIVLVKNLSNQTHTVYPNPVNGKLQIDLNSEKAEKYEIKLFNTLGQQMYSTVLIAQQGVTNHIVDVSHLNSGFYYLQIVHSDLSTSSIRILKSQ